MARQRQRGSDERLIISFLGGLSVLCIVGIIVLDVTGKAESNDALLTIGSLCAGALASRISQKKEEPGTSVAVEDGDDQFAELGRAATRQIVAEAMRQMTQRSGNHDDLST